MEQTQLNPVWDPDAIYFAVNKIPTLKTKRMLLRMENLYGNKLYLAKSSESIMVDKNDTKILYCITTKDKEFCLIF